MNIRRTGHGTRVFVGIHGWSGSHKTFDPLEHYIPEDVSVFSLDLPGHGDTPPPDTWDIDNLIDELTHEIADLANPSLTLVGMCTGALISLLIATRLPATLITRIVVIDPFAYMPWYFRVFLRGQLGMLLYKSTFANPLGRWITNTVLKSKRTDETDLTDSFATIDHDVTYGYLKLFATLDGIAGFRGLSMPIDIVYGQNTFGAVKKSIPLWQSIWPQADTWEMDGAGHLPLMEATHQIAHIIFRSNAEQNDSSLPQ